MENIARNLFLLMVNLAQMNNRKKILELFEQAVSNVGTDLRVELTDDKENDHILEVGTRKNMYARYKLVPATEVDQKDFMLLQNAAQMVGVILERLEQEKILEDEKKYLEKTCKISAGILQQQKIRYQAFINQISEGIFRLEVAKPFRIDSDIEEQLQHLYENSVVAECNNTFARMHGAKSKEVILGKTIRELHDEKYLERNRQALTNFIVSGYRGTDVEVNEINREGEMKHFTNSLLGIVEDGRLVRIWGTQKDVTERIDREKELVRAKEQAEESNKLKSAFLANLSHEIRTPMNGIMGFAQMMSFPNVTQTKMREYAKTIYESSESLLNTINDLIYISRIETGEIRILEEEVDLNSLFSELYVTFESMAKRKGLEMGFEIDLPMEQRKIVVDEEKLKQVLKNLISNAVKFTKAGSVRFGCRVEEDDICFYVKDTGIGISPESRERIFERFRQGEEGTARKYQGAGLGLSIAKAFAEYLGGEIRFESEPEQGSTFFFIIPYKIRSHSEETREAISGYDWKGKTLLIVEDDAINYLFLREAVNSTGVRVLYARNGEEAVSQCREHPEIDVILMDLKMPRMDGYEATRLIRDFRENLPIIAQTAYAMPEEKKKIRVSGFDDYLIKPIDPENLLEKVAEYI